MLELKREVFKVNIYGKEVEIKKPTVKQVMDYQKKVEKGDDAELLFSFLSDLGLSKKLAYELQPEHLQVITEAVLGVKKK